MAMMTGMRTLILAAVVFFAAVPVFAVPARAQDDGKAAAEDAGLARRLELARRMHEIRPLDLQIEDAVRQLSLRYPADKRDLFISKMLQVFDLKTLTDISVRAMADTFTEAELAKMIEYNSSPEGKAATEKMPIYQSLVEPELMKKIDQAMMELRTGKASD